MKISRQIFLLFLLVGCFAGCKSDPPIVKKAKAAGMSDPSQMSETAISDWFTQHSEVTQQIAHDCAARKPAPQSQDNGPIEDQLCTLAIRSATFAHPVRVEGSGKKY
jgi:hypothetical protein